MVLVIVYLQLFSNVRRGEVEGREERKKASGGTLYSTMQPLVWLPAVVLHHGSPAVRWRCDAATSCHVRMPSLWLVSVDSMTSSVYPQQAIHMLMLAYASLIAWWQRWDTNSNLRRRKPLEAQATKRRRRNQTCHQVAAVNQQMRKKTMLHSPASFHPIFTPQAQCSWWTCPSTSWMTAR